MREKIIAEIATERFQNIYKIIGILFIGVTFFIFVAPDAFLKFRYAGVMVFNMISSGMVVIPVLVKNWKISLL